MIANQLRPKLAAGEPVYGVIGSTSDPDIVEILGICGYDFYMVDGEHGLVDPTAAANIVRACELRDMTPLIRLGQPEAKLMLPYLDAGFMGIMMPGLETPEDVQMLVEATKYPPQGKRGLGLGRAANYLLGGGGDQAAYVAQSNAATMVIPQFEDMALLGRLPALSAVPGVDGIVIGPADLSLSMGFADGPAHEEVQAVIDEAIAIIREAGVWAGITAGTAAAASAQVDRGAKFILDSLPNLLSHGRQSFLGNQTTHS